MKSNSRDLQVLPRHSTIPLFVHIVVQKKLFVHLKGNIGGGLVVVLNTVNWYQFHCVYHSCDGDH